MRFLAGWTIILILLLNSGCKVGPDYRKPDINMPGRFGNTAKDADANSAGDLSKWWTNLNDSVLDRLVNQVMQGNLDIKVAGDRLEQAQAVRGIISGSDKPQLGLQGSAMRENYSLNSLFGAFLPERRQDDFTGAFGARWELDLFGKTARSLEASDATIQVAMANQHAVMVAMSAGVAKEYILVRQLQKEIDITNRNLKIQQDTLDVVEKRFSSGLINELTVQQAKAQLQATRSILPKLDTALHQAVHRIGILTGQEPNALSNQLMAAGSIPQTKAMVPVGLPSELLTHRPDVVRAERNLAAATANIGVATADLFPRFSLTGSAGQESITSENFTDSASRFWILTSGFSWPVFDWGSIRSNIKLQNAKQKEAMDLYIKSVLTAMADVENALVAYGNEQERLKLLEEQTAANQKTLALAQERYNGGLVDFLNVLDAQRQLYQSEDTLAVSQSQLAIYLVTLYESLGGGWTM
jgi:outer membrane protein, multidrug efflux system